MGKLPFNQKQGVARKFTPPATAKKAPYVRRQRSHEDVLRTLQKGIDLQRAGKLKEAEYCYQLILRDDPEQADALNLMGVLAADGQMFELSADYLERASRQRPKDAVILNNLANAYINIGAAKLAIPLLKKACRLSSDYYEASLNLARAYRAEGRATKSLEGYEEALRKKPGNVAARLGMALSLTDAGQLDRATGMFRDIIAENPRSPMAYFGLSATRRFTPDDAEPQAIEAVLEDPTLKAEEREYLHHAAGKMYNDMKRYDVAFDHFRSAKELAGSKFDLKAYRRKVDDLIELFDADFFQQRSAFGVEDKRPVFIVGMPRSGTTLTEQIISSHPLVHGAGELVDIDRLVRQMMPLLNGERQSGKKKLRAREVVEFARKYLAEIGSGAGNAIRVTDKMPHNFMHLGFIALMFPKATVVHCQRDAMDNCVSCFTNRFNRAHGYNTDLKTMGLYYREYRRLMDHWQAVLPLDILTVQYEDTITDQEAVSRRLIDHVGIDWDDACLRFYESKRDVTTPSRWQVRQPIYQSSVKRWRNYDPFLGDLKEGLGEYFVDA